MQNHFSEYFRPTENERKKLWAEAVFIFDANVFLNLYRMSQKTSQDLMSILKKLEGRLFLPHQVGVEFFMHLEEVIAEQVNTFEQVRQFLKKIPEGFKKGFSRHPCIPITEITEALKRCTEEQIDIVSKSQEANQLNFLVYDDPILPELNTLFSECSEGPYTGADDGALNKKVDERIQHNLPPCSVPTGGKASPPPTNNPHRGDGRVWFQIVKHAETTKKPIIFVTGDMKPNWWRMARLGTKERPIGPHFELVRDVESASGNRFWMYSQDEFHSGAQQYLGMPEQTQAIAEIKQIQERGAREEEIGLSDEPKTSPLEESKNLEKAEAGRESASMEKGVGLLDEPKTRPREESINLEKAETEGRID